jgi:hypothetical protein
MVEITRAHREIAHFAVEVPKGIFTSTVGLSAEMKSKRLAVCVRKGCRSKVPKICLLEPLGRAGVCYLYDSLDSHAQLLT